MYWDSHRLVKGEDWEEGFASGLRSSLVFLPLLSYGFTAPLAALPEEQLVKSVEVGWEAEPLRRKRLAGLESDPEDNCLKELVIASSLLKQSMGRLMGAYPILVGRQHPAGHPDYPRMGDFFKVHGGGGRFPDTPSPPTARGVSNFLRTKAGYTTEKAAMVEHLSVMEAVTSMTRMQGCQLWNHAQVQIRLFLHYQKYCAHIKLVFLDNSLSTPRTKRNSHSVKEYRPLGGSLYLLR